MADVVGKVVNYYEKTKRSGGKYLQVVVEVNGETLQFICTDQDTMNAVRNSVDKDLSFYTFASRDGTATFMNLPKPKGGSSSSGRSGGSRPPASTGGGSDNRNLSFACSYAKDIVVATINQGKLSSLEEIKAAILDLEYFFMQLLEPTDPPDPF